MTVPLVSFRTLTNILHEFHPISLKEMDSVRLLNRQDTKFVLTRKKLAAVLKSIQSDYRVLEVNNLRSNSYETLYYDTADLVGYNLHHNGRANRYKVRFRKYVESDLSFFEIKFKSNKNRTIKNRIIKPDIGLSFDERDLSLIKEHTPLKAEKLVPKLWVYFTRITLVSSDLKERMTIDLNLKFKAPDSNEAHPLNDMVIIEVKQERFNRQSKVIKALHKHQSYPLKISKYCLGIISCYKEKVRINKFKQKFLKISKITSNDLYRTIITD